MTSDVRGGGDLRRERDSSSPRSELLGACYAFPSTVILANEMEWQPMWAEAPGGGANSSCGGGGGGGRE